MAVTTNVEEVIRSYIGGLAHVHTRLSNYPGHRESDQSVASFLKYLEETQLLGTAHSPWQYLVITNHASNPVNPRPLGLFSLRARALTRTLWQDKRLGVPILYGFEASILADGTTDLTPRLLRHARLVIASCHGNVTRETAVRHQVFIRACELPDVHVLGHPMRGIELDVHMDWASVFAAAARTNTAIEVNVNSYIHDQAFPDRMAAWAMWLTKLADSTASVFIGYDLHNLYQLERLNSDWHNLNDPSKPSGLRDCVMAMKRAGIVPERVINREYLAFLAWLERKP